MTLDEATRDYLERSGALDAPRPGDAGPAAARAALSARQRSDPPGPAMARVDDTTIDVPGGSIHLRWLAPAAPWAALSPVIVFFHGGGWVLGDVEGSEPLVRRLAAATGCETVSVGYRLAPEHPYPAAVEDAWRALLTVRADRPGRPLVVAGDSAGGNLAAAVALRARDADVAVAAQVLVYPVTDADLGRPGYLEPENQLVLDARTMSWFWDQYVPEPGERSRPDASPLRAPDHSGLAPALVLTAEHDVLREEGEEYARVLAAAGVTVIQRRFAGQMHAFLGMAELPGSAAALDFIAQAMPALLSERAAPPSREGEE